MVGLGFVSHEVIGEVPWLDAIFHVVPAWLAALSLAVPPGWFEALWFLGLFPLAVWAIVAGLARLLGHRAGLRALLLAATTGAAPVVAIAPLGKATAKIGSWGGFLPLALRDPHGVETARRIADDSLVAPAASFALPTLAWVLLAVMLAVVWGAWRSARQIPGDSAIAARTGLAGAAVLFGAVLGIWAW